MSLSPSAGDGQISVGTALNTGALITSTAAASLGTKEIWHDVAPDSTVELASVLTQKVVTDSIIQTVSGEVISGGAIEYACMWYPLTPDSSLVAA